MSITITPTGYFSITDTTVGTLPFKKVFSVGLTGASAFSETQSGFVGTTPTSQVLPISPTQFLYIKNLHATQTLAVTWTPTGGASNIVMTLQPQSAIFFLEAAAGGGITALSLTGSGAATTYEMILGG